MEMEAGEAGREAAAAEEGADGGDGVRAQRSHGTAVVGFVAGKEIVPGGVDDLPEGRGARAARVVNGGHECPWKHASGQRRTAQAVSGGELYRGFQSRLAGSPSLVGWAACPPRDATCVAVFRAALANSGQGAESGIFPVDESVS